MDDQRARALQTEPTPCRAKSAICRHRRLGAQSLCSLWVASDICPSADCQAFRSSGAPACGPDRCAATRLAPRQRAPRCAKSRPGAQRPRRGTEPGALGRKPRRILRHRLTPSLGMRTGGSAGLTCCKDGNSHRGKGAAHKQHGKCRRTSKRDIVAGQGAPRPSRLRRAVPAIPTWTPPIPLAGRQIAPLRCCTFLLYPVPGCSNYVPDLWS